MSDQTEAIGGPKPTPVINPNMGRVTPRIIQASELSHAERLLMEKQFGYDGNSPVPSDIGQKLIDTSLSPEQIAAERRRVLLEAAAAMPAKSIAVPTGLNPETVTTQQLDITDAELQQLFASKPPVPPQPAAIPATAPQLPFKKPPVATSATTQFEQLRQSGVEAIQTQKEMGDMHPDIAKAFQMTQTATTQPTAAAATPPTSEKPPATAPVGVAENTNKPKTREELLQARRELYDSLAKQLDPEDFARYKQAVITGELYTKTYEALGHSLSLTFADATGVDEDALLLQRTIDRYKRRYMQTDDDLLAAEASFRLAVATCLRRIVVRTADGREGVFLDIPTTQNVNDFVGSMDRNALCPKDLHDDDTNIYAWGHYLFNQLLTGSLRQHAIACFRRFQAHLNVLQTITQDPDSF